MPWTNEQIAENASRFLEEQNAVRFPVDTYSLARGQGFKLEWRDFRQIDSDIIGMILVNDSEKIIEGVNMSANRIIAMSDALSEAEERYILAHELGHFRLHRQPLFAFSDRESQDNLNDPKEREAERFARELMMPERAMRTATTLYEGDAQYKSMFTSLVEYISAMFFVPLEKAGFRLNELGLTA